MTLQKIYIICDGSLVTNEEPMMNEINNIPEMSISRNNIEMLYVDYISEAAVSNGFIYLLSSFDNQNVMKRLEALSKHDIILQTNYDLMTFLDMIRYWMSGRSAKV